ncbi:zinc ABC transporter substrate-binding protein [Hwanghaeella sp.]|uniref:zinc ABC transporter substrate-binding protein n=1 Tax=Hwanghaeella sp. TaxID=2605943 RepID=UPI003CCC188B
MRPIRSAFAAGLVSLLSTPVLADSAPEVMTSIKPVHSLVSAVMEGVSEPGLIVEGAASPHSYALKPSQAAKLSKATHVFWIGHDLEAFLEKPIETVAANAHAVELLEINGLKTLEFREGGAFESHEHHEDEHEDHAHEEEHKGHDDHDDHAHEKHDDHDHGEGHAEDDKGHEHDGDAHAKHEEHDHDEHDHGEHEGHDHEGLDPHIWLDPQNAIVMVRAIADVLSADDPAHADRYAANAAKTIAALEKLTDEIAELMAPVHDKDFVVFHDAYRYFEERFGLHAAGSITISPEMSPGADRIREIRKRVKDLGATCVFAEPQFEPRLITVVLEGSNAKSGLIDPLGADLEDGPELYFTLIRNMAKSMHDCLS